MRCVPAPAHAHALFGERLGFDGGLVWLSWLAGWPAGWIVLSHTPIRLLPFNYKRKLTWAVLA